MTLQTSQHIQRAFSQSAFQYDRWASLHRQVADDLLDGIKTQKPSACIDVGCGTGYLAIKAKEHFPESKVVGLDFAQGMLEVARQKSKDITWVLADSQQIPFGKEDFDLVVSNLSYQWAMDLPQAFSEVRRVLSDQGTFACTLFGYQTCQELFDVLILAAEGNLQFNRLPAENQVRQALGEFKDVRLDIQVNKAEFKSMQDLMVWLKVIGANHLGKEGFVGPKVMAQAQALYQEKFPYGQGVMATFEIIRIYAQK